MGELSHLETATSHDNWDDDHGNPVAANEWRDASALLSVWASTPFVSACGDGSVHMQWTVDNRRGVLELSPSAAFWTILETGASATLPRRMEQLMPALATKLIGL